MIPITVLAASIGSAIGTGAALGGAGTLNRKVARVITRVTGGTPDGFRETFTEYVVPTIVVGVATVTNPASLAGHFLTRAAMMGGSMAIVQTTARLVGQALGDEKQS
jgi:hypothetical protein